MWSRICSSAGGWACNMAKHWIAGAIKHPGALTKKAHAAGESPMGFAKWFPAIWLIANAKNGMRLHG